jgi:hypothetical protein
MKNSAQSRRPAAIEAKSNSSGDWRAGMLTRIRALILEADPEIVEENKWAKATNPAGVPVFSHGGIVCTLESYKSVVKLTFARGASLKDTAGLFNSSLEGKTRRAIDIHEGDKINEESLRDLVRAAVAINLKSDVKPKRPK